MRVLFRCYGRLKNSSAKRTEQILQAFYTLYLKAHLHVNSFLGESKNNVTTRHLAIKTLDSFERMVANLRTDKPPDAIEFIADMAAFTDKAVLSVAQRSALKWMFGHALATLRSLLPSLYEHWAETKRVKLRELIKISINFVSRSLEQVTTQSEMEALLSTRLEGIRNPMIFEIRTRCMWTERWSLKDVVQYEKLLDPGFRFSGKDEKNNLSMDILNRVSVTIINMIKVELESEVYAVECIRLWSLLVECALHITTNEVSMFTFVPDAMIQAKQKLSECQMTWDNLMAFMDAVANDMNRVFKLDLWADERPKVLSRTPNAIQAVVYGLSVLWDIQRRTSIHAINRAFVDIPRRPLFMSFRQIYDSHVVHGSDCFGTTVALHEVAKAYPGLMKLVVEKKKGAKRSFHGMFMAKIVFDRCVLTHQVCPETLNLEGARLVALQKKAHFLMDAVIILDCCLESEHAPALEYIRAFTGERLLPVFMPMLSPASADKAEFRGKHQRVEFEKQLAKLVAVGALQMTKLVWNGAHACMQPELDAIIRELTVLIDINRCIYRRKYSELIHKLVLIDG